MFQLVQILYWLGLSTWFGGTLFIAIAAPIIFRTVRAANPTLPRVRATTLLDQHPTLLAGQIVGNLLNVLTRVSLVCGVLLVAGLIGQRFVLDPENRGWPLAVRSVLVLGCVAILIYNWLFIWPRIEKARATYLDNADEPEIANPAKDDFDRLHHESVLLLQVQLFLLLGLTLFSAALRFGESMEHIVRN